MKVLCDDCLYQSYTGGVLCEKCMNGSKFTPSVIGTELVLRSSWHEDPKIRRQLRLLCEDATELLLNIEAITDLPIEEQYSNLFTLLETIVNYCQ